jgi:ribosomal protein S18 acetylase RimI-like enzyme
MSLPASITIRTLGPPDLATLLGIADGLFDNPIRPAEARAFLADPANLLLLAFDGAQAVGMLTATFLRHPDKPLSLFVNELGTRDGWQRQGIATALMTRALAIARARGARGTWLGTDADNTPAIAFYRSLKAAELPGVFFGWDGALDQDQDPTTDDGDCLTPDPGDD